MFSGFLYLIIGVFLIWLGSFQLICSMLPKEQGIQVAEWHGRWVRENVFHLPPANTTATSGRE